MINRRKVLSILGLSSLLPAALSTTPHSANASEPQETALDSWKTQIRYPVTQSNEQGTDLLIKAAAHKQPIAFYYFGGTNPRQLRRASVESVFRLPESSHTYITAYCHLRGERRTFRVDRLSLA